MRSLLARGLGLAGLGLLLGALRAEALDPEAIPIYGGSMLGDLRSQEWAKSQTGPGRMTIDTNPLHNGRIEVSVAAHMGGTALVVWGDSKLPKKWQRWTLRAAYVVWTGWKVRNNIRAGSLSRGGAIQR